MEQHAHKPAAEIGPQALQAQGKKPASEGQPRLTFSDGPMAIDLLRLQRLAGNQAIALALTAPAVQREAATAPTTYPGPPMVGGKATPGTAVSSELSDAPPGKEPAERVFKWLQARAGEIAGLEAQFGVDRRAIAGAVAWEALQNVHGSGTHLAGRYSGAGKPHVRDSKYGVGLGLIYPGENVPEEVEQAGLLPPKSAVARELALRKDSLPYIAAGMRLATDITKAYGRDISGNPAMLTWFWQSQNAEKLIDHYSKKSAGDLDPMKEKMPQWVMENLSWLTDAVGNSELGKPAAGKTGAPSAPSKVGTLETESWHGSYNIGGRLPETREFLVTGDTVTVTISADSDYVSAVGFYVFAQLHRRSGGSGKEVGDSKQFEIGKETTLTWTNLTDGIYFLEIYQFNGITVSGEFDVRLPPHKKVLAAPAAGAAAVQKLSLQREPTATEAPIPAPTATPVNAPDAGTPKADAGTLRAEATRQLVQQLQANQAKYGHELNASKTERKEGWWWEETEFDCSKFVLWVMAGRKVGDAQPAATDNKTKAIQQVKAEPFGNVADASSVAAMVDIIDKLVKAGKAQPIDPKRAPRVGDLMFWGGHVAIVVEVADEKGDSYVVYANMGTSGADLVGLGPKGGHWLKASELAKYPQLAAGAWLGYWTP